jgi:recombination protein RecA
MERRRLKPAATNGGGDYFPAPKTGLDFLPTGCTLLDCVLGGGWAMQRIANIVGDRSSGKTLLAIEACANFAQKYPQGKIWYREAEAAFDEGYASELGLPVKRVDFGKDGLDTNWDTIEDIFEDLEAKIKESETSGKPGLYIIDSLDALSSRAELDREIDKGSYGLEKPKMLGKLFRQLTRRIKAANICVLVISQLRDKIGVTFGEKQTRTGGRALDFYATHILWLSHISTLTRTVGGTKRATGVRIKAKCKKNKVGAPFRDCVFDVSFGYGIEDVDASLTWLEELKKEKLVLGDTKKNSYLDYLDKLEGALRRQELMRIRSAVIGAWQEIEKGFAPPRRKYG